MPDDRDETNYSSTIHVAIVVAAAVLFVGTLALGVDWYHLALIGNGL